MDKKQIITIAKKIKDGKASNEEKLEFFKALKISLKEIQDIIKIS